MRKLIGTAVVAAIASTGCSWESGAMTGGRMAWNLSKKDSHLSIYLDGMKAEQNKLKKAASGYSGWKIKDQTSTSPVLRFDISDPDKLGRITMVIVSIHQEFEADYSHQAEFTISANSQDPQAQMKPGVDYNLGNPGPGFRVTNLTGQTVSGVMLAPGKKYQLSITVRADKSETGLVEFKTN